MAIPCQIVLTDGRFSSSLIGFLDCQAQTLGAQGYQALAAPGSSASLVLTALLTLFVALFGYRMLLGETTSLRESLLAMIRVGIVLALATSWPAYQAIVYDVVLRAPGNLAAEIGAPAGLPGATGGLPTRLDEVDQGFRTLAIYGVGALVADPTGQIQPPAEVAPPLFIGFDTFALGGSRVVFLVTAVGAFALVRLAAGLLLALGPLFIGFLLFDATRGLFEGWARALIGLALAALGTAMLLGVELALLEPWLSELLRIRAAGGTIAGAPAPLLATTVIFALVLAALLAIMGRIGWSLRLPSYRRLADAGIANGRGQLRQSELAAVRPGAPPAAARSRAMAISDSIAATQRREEQIIEYGAQTSAGRSSVAARGRASVTSSTLDAGLPPSGRRRTVSRISGSAGLRDRRP